MIRFRIGTRGGAGAEKSGTSGGVENAGKLSSWSYGGDDHGNASGGGGNTNGEASSKI